jgi:hypothetical protein
MSKGTLSPEDYTVGILCGMKVEMEAVQATFDEEHGQVQKTSGDDNTYAFGNIGEHNVVLACPTDGRSPAVTAARGMMRSFPIKVGLMVGIGAGSCTEHADIRLGDVVVIYPDDSVHLEIGKKKGPGGIWTTGLVERPLQPPHQPNKILQILSRRHAPKDGGVGIVLEVMSAEHPLLRNEDRYPGLQHDKLGESCANCDRSHLVSHWPHFFREEDMPCFETEAAGLMATFPCVVIRGICDYDDSHGEKRRPWQGYAAAMAAAYAKELLLILSMSAADPTTIQLASEATSRKPPSHPEQLALD